MEHQHTYDVQKGGPEDFLSFALRPRKRALTTIESQPQVPSSLLTKLPLELRQLIWQPCIGGQKILLTLDPGYLHGIRPSSYQQNFLSLLLTCRQMCVVHLYLTARMRILTQHAATPKLFLFSIRTISSKQPARPTSQPTLATSTRQRYLSVLSFFTGRFVLLRRKAQEFVITELPSVTEYGRMFGRSWLGCRALRICE